MNEHATVLTHDRLGAVQTVKPVTSAEVKLTADSDVLCIHRGRNLTVGGRLVRADTDPRRPVHDETRQPGIPYVGDLQDMFDSVNYIIAPGYFTCRYGAAKHFKDRAVVPGSRNPETRTQSSFIAIIGIVQATPDGLKVLKAVDDPFEWDPFTDEECRQYSLAVEALDRSGMVDPIDEKVEVVRIAGGVRQTSEEPVSRVKGGAGGRRGGATRIEGGKGGERALRKGTPDSGRLGDVGESEAAAAANAAARGGQPVDLGDGAGPAD